MLDNAREGPALPDFRGPVIATPDFPEDSPSTTDPSVGPPKLGSIVQLNDRWRVNGTDGMQWQLEQRAAQGRWRPKKFHAERDCLLKSIRRMCGEASPAAIARIRLWPAIYPGKQSK